MQVTANGYLLVPIAQYCAYLQFYTVEYTVCVVERQGGKELTLNAAGESVISYADFAIAMVDEIESGNHVQQRISTVRK